MNIRHLVNNKKNIKNDEINKFSQFLNHTYKRD